MNYFGDSYDIVKKSLLQWLSPFGPWCAHPMFTHAVTDAEAMEFSRFLGVPLVSVEVLSQGSDRRTYLEACGGYPSIFLDPDTGVRIHRRQQARSTEFVFGDELLDLAKARAHGLVLVFDKSVARGNERRDIQAKLDHFRDLGLSGFGYISQACFIVLGESTTLVRDAQHQLGVASRLPSSRIIAGRRPKGPRRPPHLG